MLSAFVGSNPTTRIYIMKTFELKKGVEEIKNRVIESKKSPVLIGIAGGSASGKGYISKMLAKILNGKVIGLDEYNLGRENIKDNNFDSVDAYDIELLKSHLKLLKQNIKIGKPVYDFKLSKRIGYEEFAPCNFVIVEGFLLFNDKLTDEFDFKIFVDSSPDVRLQRRIKRDIAERGSTEESVKRRWFRDAEPAFKKFVEPKRRFADFIIVND